MDARAMELAVYLNIVTERWKANQNEPVDANLVSAAVAYFLVKQSMVLGRDAGRVMAVPYDMEA